MSPVKRPEKSIEKLAGFPCRDILSSMQMCLSSESDLKITDAVVLPARNLVFSFERREKRIDSGNLFIALRDESRPIRKINQGGSRQRPRGLGKTAADYMYVKTNS